jgi:hypothetical protein
VKIPDLTSNYIWVSAGLIGTLALAATLPAFAAEPNRAANDPDSSLAASIGIYVYPENGQDQEQQIRDDYDCYRSAKSRTGFDPLNPGPRPQVAESDIESRAPKESVKDVAGGAAVGAVIGEIGRNDAGEGAAIGGFLGAIRAYNKNKSYKERQRRHAELNIDAEIEHNRLNFKNAFSACLIARGYAVR